MPGQPLSSPATPPPAQPQSEQAAQAHKHIWDSIGKGVDTEYNIDPQTGKTVATQTPQKPGQFFRNILAAAATGAQGIGPNHGEQNFAQGLMAGLSGGVTAASDLTDKQNAEKRAQAQQDYQNQLKAQESQRQQNDEVRKDKELTLRQQLNKASVANMNSETHSREVTLNKLMGENSIQSAQFSEAADKWYVDSANELGIQPINGLVNVPFDKIQEYVSKANPGWSAESAGKVTGHTTAVDPKTGEITVEKLWSVFPPLNKVPPTLLKEMEQDGASDPKNPLHATYAELSGAKDGTYDFSRLMTVAKQVKTYEGVQTAYKKTLMDDEDLKAKKADEAWKSSEIGMNALKKRQLMAELGPVEDIESGKKLYVNLLGEHKIPRKADQTLDFDAYLNTLKPEDRASQRRQLYAYQGTRLLELQKEALLLGNNKEDPKVKTQLDDTMQDIVSTQGSINSLTGGNAPATTKTDPVSLLINKHVLGLNADSGGVFKKIASSGVPLSQALTTLQGIDLPTEEKNKVSSEIQSFYTEAAPVIQKKKQETEQSNQAIQSAGHEAWRQENPTRAAQAYGTTPILNTY
jgi:hypothetical protein